MIAFFLKDPVVAFLALLLAFFALTTVVTALVNRYRSCNDDCCDDEDAFDEDDVEDEDEDEEDPY